MNAKYEKLKTLLKELFQLDQPDLDFGLYRIMHAKSAEITQFLDKDLLPQVRTAFEAYQPADKAALQKELDKLIANVEAAGMDPDQSPKVQELREKLKNDAVDIGALENEVYDHLYSFFRRYYSEGDFLAKRVYKPGVYAIPYEGEEVALHWANKDQYYIKTSEYLRDYAFRLQPEDEANPMRVRFRLVDAAEGEHGNVKAAEGKDRVFVLAAPGESGRDFIAEEEGDLVIRFEYRAASLDDWLEDGREGKTKPPAQKDLIEAAVKRVLALPDKALAPWLAKLSSRHVKADAEPADYSRLEAHLRRYAARNTFDYFIHKDLGDFLRRELDFYIKNEVMHLDDVESESVPKVEQYLSKIRIIRRVAGTIIDFIAQIENFQKKIWLKKKFVTEAHYCIALGSVPEDFYPEIALNDSLREEWVALLGIDQVEGDLTTPGYSVPLTLDFLKANPTLVLDSRHLEEDARARLIEALGDLDQQTDAVVLHSDNFQALSFMQARYQGQISSVYIDPPYNTDASPIVYKNGYRRSSWISLLADRLDLDSRLRSHPSVRCIAIDDFEYPDLQGFLEASSGEVHHATVAVRSKPQGRPTSSGFSANHEYAVFWGGHDAKIGRLPRAGSKADRYGHSDEKGIYAWANLRKSGTDSDRADRPKSFYPVYCSAERIWVPQMAWNEQRQEWEILEQCREGEVAVWPVDADGREKVWTCSAGRLNRELGDIRVDIDSEGHVEIYKKYRPNQGGALPGTWWDDSRYSASESGTKVLKDLFGVKDFDYPKSVHLVADCLRVAALEDCDTVLDYFAGSGTTGHAVINLNREDGGRRRFILIEAGSYFDTVLLPRIKKVIFTPEWGDGRPTRIASDEEAARGPRIVKVIRLESYEDSLNNLELRRSERQSRLLESLGARGSDDFKRDYTLRYLLDVETRGSQSLLNVKAFADPTAYTLKIKPPGSDEIRKVNVNLLETFNWLIGLRVEGISVPRTFTAEFERDSEGRLRLKGTVKRDQSGPWWFRTITGRTVDGRKTLVIWRKRPGRETPEGVERDNLVLDEWFSRQGYSSKDSEFDLIYVNGDNNLENLKTPDDKWKVRLIEEDFHRLMFDTGGV